VGQSEPGQSAAKPIADFLLEDYRIKVQYLTDQFTRMWNRFQFLLGLETVVAGLHFAPLTTNGAVSSVTFAGLGAAVSAFWYIVGAEDRFLVDLYRSQLEATAVEAAASIGLGAFTYAGNVRDASVQGSKTRVLGPLKLVSVNILEWRVASLSTTHLVAAFPLAALTFWIVVLLIQLASVLTH
jgi:hypothetical protein